MKSFDVAAEYGYGCVEIRTFPDYACIDLAVLLCADGFVFRVQAFPVVRRAFGKCRIRHSISDRCPYFFPNAGKPEFKLNFDVSKRVGHARGIVMRFDLVMAQTCYPALIVGLLPRGFGEDTPLFETLVGHVGLWL